MEALLASLTHDGIGNIVETIGDENIKLTHINKKKANQVADWLSMNDFLFNNVKRWSNMPKQFVTILQNDILLHYRIRLKLA